MVEKRKPQTNILVDYEEKMSREQAASLLESIAAKLKNEGSFTLHVGDQSQLVEPSDTVTLEIELEERNGKYELEFELEWKEGQDRKQTLRID
ncbi:MAG TPA: amphi-Trp domain-containing protein [Cerasibacillus sp.]|uniref:amphi-Trp domain-containing protein n=1 Tax=Cerasibacillus sp. TaxID=2498711 RepID=UPI002F3E89A7